MSKRIFLLWIVIFFGLSSCPAQLKIDSIGLLGRDKISLSDDFEFDQKIVLFGSGKDDGLKDLSQTKIYINGKKMPSYSIFINCASCAALAKPNTGKSSAKPDTSKAAAKPDTGRTEAKSISLEAPQTCWTVTFKLTRDSTETWDHWYGFGNPKKNFNIDLGNNDKVLTCNTKETRVGIYSVGVMVAGSLLVLLFILLSLGLAFKKGNALLRDVSKQKDSKCKPFSLSRFQLFWWSIIVISCYILLFALRGHLDIMNTTALILLGISILPRVSPAS